MTKIDPKYRYYAKKSHLAHLIVQSNHKNTFRPEQDGIYSKLIVKQWGVTLYMDTRGGGQIPKLCPKITPDIDINANNHLIMQSDHNKSSRTKPNGIS